MASKVTLRKKNHVSAPFRKKKLSPSNDASRKANNSELVEKSGVSDSIQSLEKSMVARFVRKSCLGVFNPFEMDEEDKKLINSTSSRAETGQAGRKDGLDTRKKSRQDGMMLSNSFEKH